MSSITNRRTKAGYALRVYLEQIDTVSNMTQEQWLDQWVPSGLPWIPRDMRLAYLKECALIEAKKLTSIPEWIDDSLQEVA